MEPKDPSRDDESSLEPNSSAEDFFSKMNRDFRRPKPSEEAVAAALQAIQALAGDSVLEENSETEPPQAQGEIRAGAECPKCHGVNSESNRFCGFCGTALDQERKIASISPVKSVPAADAQHVHHHHYHHHYFPGGSKPTSEGAPGYSFRPAAESLSSGESPEPPGADTVLRKLVQDWVLLCNGKRVEELAMLYAGDALLIRPGVAMARGQAAIRESLQADLDTGLGDVQLECTDVSTLDDVACLTGINRMLLPVSPANRQERTGKFLLLVRREGPSWCIVADVWCLDNLHPAAPQPRK